MLLRNSKYTFILLIYNVPTHNLQWYYREYLKLYQGLQLASQNVPYLVSVCVCVCVCVCVRARARMRIHSL